VYDPAKKTYRSPADEELAPHSAWLKADHAQTGPRVGTQEEIPTQWARLKDGEVLFNVWTHYYDETVGEPRLHLWNELREMMNLRSDVDYLASELSALKGRVAELEAAHGQPERTKEGAR